MRYKVKRLRTETTETSHFDVYGLCDGDRVLYERGLASLDFSEAAKLLNSETAPLHARIAELEAALGVCISALDRTLYTHTPKDPQTVIDNAKQVLYKKAPDHE